MTEPKEHFTVGDALVLFVALLFTGPGLCVIALGFFLALAAMS